MQADRASAFVPQFVWPYRAGGVVNRVETFLSSRAYLVDHRAKFGCSVPNIFGGG